MTLFDRLLTLASRIVLWLDSLRPKCPVCDKPLHRGDRTAMWHVEHLGASVAVHWHCRPMRQCKLGQVVRT